MLTLIKRYRHVNWAIADQAMVSGANFLTGILVARFIGMEEFGQYALAWVVLELVLSFQQSVIMAPMMSIGPQYKDAEMPAFFGAVITQQALFVVVSFVAFLLAAAAAVQIYPEWKNLTISLACLLVAAQLQNFVRRYLFTRGRSLTAFLSDAIRYLGQMAMLVALLQVLAIDAAGALWALTTTALFGAGFGACFLGQIAWDRQVFIQVLHRHWDFAKWLLSSEVMRWATGNLFIVLAGALLGAIAVGAIRAAQQLVGICHIIQLGLENIVPVRAARHLRDGQMPALLRYIKQFATFGGLAIGVIVVTAAVAPEFWLGLVYGTEYQGNGHVVRWWCVIYFLGFLSRPLVIGLRTLEKTGVIFWAHFASAVFTAIACYPLIFYFDVVGVMIGLTVIVIIRLSMMYYGFAKLILK